MGQSRPSTQVVQRTLIIGALIGILLGCIIGSGLVALYIRQNPPVYAGGAFPAELTQAYQEHYLAMTVDSYLVNQQADVAAERLKTFATEDKIRILGERSAAYVAAGRGVEAQLINNLAVTLKSAEIWDENVIKIEVGKLAVTYQGDPARAQAINTFSAQLLEGQIPDLAAQPQGQPPAEQPATTQEPATATPADGSAAADSGGGFSPVALIFCCLALILGILVVYFVGKRRFEARKAPPKQQIVWEGEGVPPLKQWTGTYTIGQDNYDEFFTIETNDGDFLGESGMGILESLPGSSPKQVLAFDVGLFDKTDITTLSRVVMTPSAYNNETIRTKIEANPQAEAVVAEPGKTFSFETSALRIEARIDDMALGTAEGGQSYFERLKVSMDLFLKEGADLRKGEMDIPEEFQ